MVSTTENPTEGMFEFQSLGNQVVDAFRNAGKSKNLYTFSRLYDDFRPASKDEIATSDKVRAKYKLIHLLNLLNVTQETDFGFNKF